MTNYQFIRKNPIILITTFCLFIFGAAIVIEYGFKVPSCKLCVYQRIPYILTILAGLLLYFFSKVRLYLILTVLFQIIGLGIAIFHSLIERGIIHYEMGCTSVKNNFENIDELRSFLEAAPITKCNEINFSFLGLSLANMNILVSILIILLTTVYLIDHEQKK
jgi:disulfide bond formation protein DsbB